MKSLSFGSPNAQSANPVVSPISFASPGAATAADNSPQRIGAKPETAFLFFVIENSLLSTLLFSAHRMPNLRRLFFMYVIISPFSRRTSLGRYVPLSHQHNNFCKKAPMGQAESFSMPAGGWLTARVTIPD
jgi:hypothetical protein